MILSSNHHLDALNPSSLLSLSFVGSVRETLNTAAALRLPAGLSDDAIRDRVDAVIWALGLKDVADTRIGSEMQRGISGGEKRRVSIGVQLLTDPQLLVLDEPTTGLDSFTSHNLAQHLVQLARQGKTVILSIHQPRSDIFHLFDDILLLARGHIVYSVCVGAGGDLLVVHADVHDWAHVARVDVGRVLHVA